MDLTTTVKVTVLMTLYNKEAYVAEAVRSVLDQTFGDFELLVVDDASPDNSVKVVQGFDDPRIRLIRARVNQGRAGAANRGYEAARGEYIAVLDADDRMAPGRLARQVAFLEAQPEVDIVGSYSQRFGSMHRISKWPLTDAKCKGRMFFADPVLYGSSMIRRSVFVRTGIRSDPEWKLPAEDYLLMLRLGPYVRFANIPEVLTHQRMGEQNQRHGRDAYADRKAIYRQAFKLKGLSVSEEEIETHLLFYLEARGQITSWRVRAMWDWVNKLSVMNRERGLFPPAEFDDEMWRRWGRLFFLLPEHGLAPTFTWLCLSRKWPRDWLPYLLKVTLVRWTGRRSTGFVQTTNMGSHHGTD